MKKRYILPAVTAEGQDTSIGVLIDDAASLREWLSCVRRREVVLSFRFHWFASPRSTVYPIPGSFCVIYSLDGIYIKLQLWCRKYYRDGFYSLEEFCRMIAKGTRPSLGWSITVTVQ